MRKLSKRTLAVTVPLGVLGIAGVAYAATLSMSSAGLQAGSTGVGSCESSATVDYDTGYDADSGEYVLSAVNVAFPGASCDGYAWKLTAVHGAATDEFTSTSSTLVAGGVIQVDATAKAIPAADLDHIALVMSKATG